MSETGFHIIFVTPDTLSFVAGLITCGWDGAVFALIIWKVVVSVSLINPTLSFTKILTLYWPNWDVWLKIPKQWSPISSSTSIKNESTVAFIIP